MNTTEAIQLLKRIERGGSGRSREISFKIDDEFIYEPDITIDSTGDGICGAEVCLKITKKER
jgi:hypothetical protein